MANTRGKEVEIIIDKESGEIQIDQIGYRGHECSGDILDLVNALGNKKRVQRKREYYDNKVRINNNS